MPLRIARRNVYNHRRSHLLETKHARSNAVSQNCTHTASVREGEIDTLRKPYQHDKKTNDGRQLHIQYDSSIHKSSSLSPSRLTPS